MANHSNSLDIIWDVGVAIARTNPIPLDSTQNHASLTALQTYAKDGATSYVGQQVNVVSDAGVLDKAYIIKNKSGELLELATKTDIEALSGVFQFKGVAEAINPDQSIITIRKVNTKAVIDDQGKEITPSVPLYCVTTAYEFDMDVYYGWGTSLEDIRFWTDATTVNKNTPQYDKSSSSIDVTAYEFNGMLYYPIDSAVAPTAGDAVTPYENVDGQIIYISESEDVYNNDDAAGGSIGTATPVVYTSYDFTVKTSPINLEDNITTSETITAFGNTGRVYQIGENEYASNGQIWVKLGSPVEDWIII